MQMLFHLSYPKPLQRYDILFYFYAWVFLSRLLDYLELLQVLYAIIHIAVFIGISLFQFFKR